MIVAFRIPHNEGLIRGVITGPGFDTETHLVDLYEVDGSITSHATVEEAEAWLVAEGKSEYGGADDVDLSFERTNVRGGYIEVEED